MLEYMVFWPRRLGASDPLVDILLKRTRDPSSEVRYVAVKGVANFVCFGADGRQKGQYTETQKHAIEVLQKVSSLQKWPISQEAFEALVRIGEFNIDDWTAGETKALVERAEAALVAGDTHLGASLAAQFFDEIFGPATMAAVEELGDRKFEQLLLLALPSSESLSKKDIIWQLSRIGSAASLPALVKEATSKGPKEDFMAPRFRLEAVNALVCIGSEHAISAILNLINSEDWETKLLGIVGLMRGKLVGRNILHETDLTKLILICWNMAKVEMLRFLSRIKGGLLYYPGECKTGALYSIDVVIDDMVLRLPREEARSAACEILGENWGSDFGFSVIGALGTSEDLPLLHAKLQNIQFRESAKKAIDRIQYRMK